MGWLCVPVQPWGQGQSPEPQVFSWIETSFNCEAFVSSTLSNDQAGALLVSRDTNINVFRNPDSLTHPTREQASLSFWRLLDINKWLGILRNSKWVVSCKKRVWTPFPTHTWIVLIHKETCWGGTRRESECESPRAEHAGPFTQGATSATAKDNRQPGQLPLSLLPITSGSLFRPKKILDQQIQNIVEFGESREILISHM